MDKFFLSSVLSNRPFIVIAIGLFTTGSLYLTFHIGIWIVSVIALVVSLILSIEANTNDTFMNNFLIFVSTILGIFTLSYNYYTYQESITDVTDDYKHTKVIFDKPTENCYIVIDDVVQESISLDNTSKEDFLKYKQGKIKVFNRTYWWDHEVKLHWILDD